MGEYIITECVPGEPRRGRMRYCNPPRGGLPFLYIYLSSKWNAERRDAKEKKTGVENMHENALFANRSKRGPKLKKTTQTTQMKKWKKWKKWKKTTQMKKGEVRRRHPKKQTFKLN